MKSHAGFVRDICESPEDDAPRLVYADWLDDEGEAERAEFIRLQCSLDSGDPYAPGRRALLRREWELLVAHGERWIREEGLAGSIAPESLWHYPPKARFRRGFVDRAWFLDPEDFWTKAPTLFERAPITGVSLHSPHTVPAGREQWFQNTYMTLGMRALGLPAVFDAQPRGDEFPDPEEFRRLVESPHFGRLDSFTLSSLYADPAHLAILANSPSASGLSELDLSNNLCIVGEAWSALAGSPGFAGLRSLRIDDCHLRTAGLRSLVESPHLGGLRRLSLEADPDRHALGPEGLAVLCASESLPALSELNLSGQAGGAAGLQSLAKWPGLARITRLDLSHFWSEQAEGSWREAWTDFVHSPHWGDLRELDLEGGNLEHLEAILDGPNLATLRVLTFAYQFLHYGDDGEYPVQDDAARLLARCPHLRDGVEFQITRNGLSEAGRKLLLDRFGDGLILYPDEGRHRQPGEWSSGRPSRSTFAEG